MKLTTNHFQAEVEHCAEYLSTTEGDEHECITIENLQGALSRCPSGSDIKEIQIINSEGLVQSIDVSNAEWSLFEDKGLIKIYK